MAKAAAAKPKGEAGRLAHNLSTSICLNHIALRQQLQPVRLLGGRADHCIEQTRKACVQIIAAQPHEAVGAGDAGLHQAAFA
ncbi:hypothetical protein ACVIN2_005401 [Bradyrhizobium sp. USDA 3650]